MEKIEMKQLPNAGEFLLRWAGDVTLRLGSPGRNEEDKIHCPNESFSLDQFKQAMTWAVLMLDALAN